MPIQYTHTQDSRLTLSFLRRKDMPAKFIYEPWLAPIEVQKKANCVVGVDYPPPMVDHATASKECIEKLAAAYKAHKEGTGSVALHCTAHSTKVNFVVKIILQPETLFSEASTHNDAHTTRTLFQRDAYRRD